MRDGLVSLTYYKVAKSVTEISNKICKSKTYDEAINDLIHDNRWCKAVDKEL